MDSDTDDVGRREVVVPERLYRTVTVLSTLIATVSVVAGIVIIDLATARATAAVDEVNPVLALAGIAVIVFGAAVYAFSTRFRAEGMGNPKDRTDEEEPNG